MTDPDRPEVVHHTTINNPPRSSGSGWLGFVIGGLVVVVAIIGFVLWSGGANVPDKVADVNIDVDIPARRMPDAPSLPPIEPPTMPSPGPAAVPAG